MPGCRTPPAAKCGQRAAGTAPHSASPIALAAAPWLLALAPSALLPGSLASADFRWIFEALVGVGSVTIGLPGIVALGIFINPMLEAMPRIRREGTVGRLPMLPYTAMAAQGLIWSTYGLLCHNPAIWTCNACALVLGLYYCWEYRSHCPKGADWLPMTLKDHAAGLVATAALCGASYMLLEPAVAIKVLGLTGNVMTMTMFGGPLAALRTVLKDQNTRAMTFGFTCIVNLNCNLWFFYAYFMLNDPFIYLQDGVGLLLTTVQLALFARYGIHR